jgi:hypothetical protein
MMVLDHSSIATVILIVEDEMLLRMRGRYGGRPVLRQSRRRMPTLLSLGGCLSWRPLTAFSRLLGTFVLAKD